MKGNNPPMTPSGLLSARLRFNSINSPFISPLQIVQSPCLNDGNFLDGNSDHADLNHFQLEDEVLENQYEQIDENVVEEEEEESIRCPIVQQLQHSKDLLLDETNMLEFVLNHVNRHNEIIDEARENLQGYGTDFTRRLFDYLVNKFKKLKKTKEQMVKYCVRKSFKYITNKMRQANKQAYVNMENNEVVAQYFQMHCQGDTSISMPFKKNSEQKTMNSNFLKKIFKCRQYNIDYKDFLKQFPDQYTGDNRKKIKSMNQTIKKCQRNKCFKSLDEYKRLPWSVDLLEKIFQFAKQLMEHSPFKKEQLQSLKTEIKGKKPEKVFQLDKMGNFGGRSKQEMGIQSSNMQQDEFEIIKKIPDAPKKSIILLTPPIRALPQPQNNKQLMDLDILE